MIFDGHSDLLYALSRSQKPTDLFQQTYYEKFRQGAVEGGIFVLWGDPDSQQSMAEQIQRQLQTLQQIQQDADCFLCLLQHPEEIELAEAQKKIYFLLGVEGLDGYPQKEETIDWLYAQGARHIGLTWNHANGFAAGVLAAGGLTALGRIAVRRIQQKMMLLDVAHLNDTSLRETLALCDQPIIASHCNCRSLCNAPRNLTDAQIKAIADIGGVIGINSYPLFVAEHRQQYDLEHLADHAVHMAYLVGTQHIGFGFDFNYWDASEHAVVLPDLADNHQARNFVQLLEKRGFAKHELQAMCRENFLQLVRRTLV